MGADADRGEKARNLVGRGGDERAAEALGDLLLLLRGLLGRGAVGVELAEAGEEDEAAERGAGGVEHELLHEARRVRRPHGPGAAAGAPRRGGGRGTRFRLWLAAEGFAGFGGGGGIDWLTPTFTDGGGGKGRKEPRRGRAGWNGWPRLD